MVDILVLGATGYTGRLITEVLRNHRERSSFSFGITARSSGKLAKLQHDLKLNKDVQAFQVDVSDPEQVEKVVSQANVVINTVGPYWIWGSTVVRACVKLGRHYVDLTGETHWIRKIITECDYIATTKHCVVLPSCGFDSLPSDLAVFLSNKALKALAGPDTDIDMSTSAFRVNTTISAGSLSTMLNYVEGVPWFEKKRASADFCLSNVPGVPNPPRRMLYQLPLSNPPVYGGTFVMAAVNRAIVHRTWGLHEYDMRKSITSRTVDKRLLTYGPQFKYEEFIATSSKSTAIIVTLVMGFTAVCFLLAPVRWVVKNLLLPLLPEGPSEEIKKNGILEVTNVTSSVATPSKAPVHVRTIIRGKGEAGYYLSAYMATECALGLLLDRHDLPSLGREGGVLTPTSALGDTLVRRLEETGKFNFHTEVVLGVGESRKTR